MKTAEKEKPKNEDAETRRRNLKRLIARDFRNNLSAFARAYNPENPNPSYFSDLLADGSEKSFAEKAARKMESAAGLVKGQLDIPDSMLLQDETHRNRTKDELHAGVDELDKDEQRELLEELHKIRARRFTRRKTG